MDVIYKAAGETEVHVNEAKGVIEGYASTFGNVDYDGEIVAEGAFKKGLEGGFSHIRVLRNHHRLIGLPLEVHEDSTGLYTKSQIIKTQVPDGGMETLQLALSKALRGMSFGARIKKRDSSGEAPVLEELEIFEYSFVDWPANEESRIISTKGQGPVAEKSLWWISEAIRIQAQIDGLEAEQKWIIDQGDLVSVEDAERARAVIASMEENLEKAQSKLKAWEESQPAFLIQKQLEELKAITLKLSIA